VRIKPVPDGGHDEIIRWITSQYLQLPPDLWPYPEQVLMALRSPPTIPARTGGTGGTGIPIYLMIDRDAGGAFVYSRLRDSGYTTITRVRFGGKIELPEPLCLNLDTEPFKHWVR
jgi:hypothetical protein